MRNILAHDYRGTDLDIVFKVVKAELPKLNAAFIAFLHLFPKTEVLDALQNKYYQNLQLNVFAWIKLIEDSFIKIQSYYVISENAMEIEKNYKYLINTLILNK